MKFGIINTDEPIIQKIGLRAAYRGVWQESS